MKTIYMCTSIERRSKLQFPFNHIEYYRCSITTLCMYYYTVYCKHTCHVVVVVVVVGTVVVVRAVVVVVVVVGTAG